MKKPIVAAWLVALWGISGLAAHAASGRVALTPKASTLGLGADLSFKLTSRVNLRFLGQAFDYERNETVDDVDYDVDVALRSFGAWVDVCPSKGSFHVTGGLLANGNEVDLVAQLDPVGIYEIGGTTFTGAQLGDMNGTTEFDAIAPYLGIGWGNPFARPRRLGFAFDLGVVYQGQADVTLTATNPLGIPGLQQELDNEALEIEEDLEDYEYFPVISLGMSIRF